MCLIEVSRLATKVAVYGYGCFENTKCITGILLVTLIWTAWIFYFLICYQWVRYGYVAKNYRRLGAVFGTLAFILTIYGFLFVLPAVVLMLYIHFKVPYEKQHA